MRSLLVRPGRDGKHIYLNFQFSWIGYYVGSDEERSLVFFFIIFHLLETFVYSCIPCGSIFALVDEANPRKWHGFVYARWTADDGPK